MKIFLSFLFLTIGSTFSYAQGSDLSVFGSQHDSSKFAEDLAKIAAEAYIQDSFAEKNLSFTYKKGDSEVSFSCGYIYEHASCMKIFMWFVDEKMK